MRRINKNHWYWVLCFLECFYWYVSLILSPLLPRVFLLIRLTDNESSASSSVFIDTSHWYWVLCFLECFYWYVSLIWVLFLLECLYWYISLILSPLLPRVFLLIHLTDIESSASSSVFIDTSHWYWVLCFLECFYWYVYSRKQRTQYQWDVSIKTIEEAEDSISVRRINKNTRGSRGLNISEMYQ